MFAVRESNSVSAASMRLNTLKRAIESASGSGTPAECSTNSKEIGVELLNLMGYGGRIVVHGDAGNANLREHFVADQESGVVEYHFIQVVLLLDMYNLHLGIKFNEVVAELVKAPSRDSAVYFCNKEAALTLTMFLTQLSG